MMFIKPIPNIQQVLGISLLVLAALMVIHPINNYDIFWHLANGREMVASGGVVDTELFSYTFSGVEFNNHAWLGQIILYLVHWATGWAGFTMPGGRDD